MNNINPLKPLILALSIAPFFLLSCEKEIEFKGQETDPMLILNGFLTPDSAVAVHLSKSRFIFDTNQTFSFIENANVELFVNGAPYETLRHAGGGSYRGTYMPKERDAIAVHASAGGFEPVKAETIIPAAPSIELADSTIALEWLKLYDQYESNPEEGFVSLIQTNNIKLRLKEPENEKNGYFIKVNKTFYNNDGYNFTQPEDVDVKSILKGNVSGGTGNIFDFIDEDEWDYSPVKNLFSDDLINGQDVFLDFKLVDNIKTIPVKDENIPDDNLVENEQENTICLSSMSEEYYRFVISSTKAETSNDNPFSEPVQVTSNVENGAGILGSYTTATYTYKFKIYRYNGVYF
ncbi:MAG: DUF4249 domain-containing protein [Proteiniphilum sp.]|jgi:hypothetical protein|nr:DUF4249 domain-containing protein [Proteiniphilum sp.]